MENTAALLATRPYRTFWEWFARQRCRDDAVGELARDMWRDPGRGDRCFTAVSLGDYLRDMWGKTTELDGLMAVHARAVQEYETYRDVRVLHSLWVVYRSTGGGHQVVGAVEAESDARRVLDACCAADPGTQYTLTNVFRGTVKCGTGEHEWWDQVSATRCCTVEWRPVSVFPDRPLPERYDRQTGIVVDPSGWRWVWVYVGGGV